MTLPSQTARAVSNSASRFNTSGRSGSPLRRLVGSVLLGVVLIVFVWWAISARKPQVGGAADAPLAATPVEAPAETKVPAPADGSAKPAVETKLASESTPTNTDPQINRSLIAGSMTQPVSTPPAGAAPTAADPAKAPATPATGGAPTSPGQTGDSNPGAGGAAPGGVPAAGGAGGSGGSLVSFLVSQGDSLLAQGKVVEAREVYNRALNDSRADENDRRLLRDKMAAISDTITFSTRVEPGDSMCFSHPLAAGENLVKLANGRCPPVPDLKVDWRFLQRINKIADPGKLRLGQNLKLVKGPFHAVVYKGAFRLDLFADIADTEGHKIFIRSYPVGLGAEGSTPIGTFVVRPKSKMVNPKWVNPRTGEKFDAEDPKNPIGERWVGLQGTDKNTEMLSGYGIHGTIAPESIGHEASMGCIRMLAPDIEVVFELMSEGGSTVEIRP